jgi:5-dehydro-4-deoxyglucarate dehydratase
MKPAELKARLRGVIAFAITPFDESHHLNLDGLSQNLERMSHSGVHMLAAAGGVGEFYSYTIDEYRAVIRTAIRSAGGRTPVLVGIGHSTRIACELAMVAEAEGAAGLLINPFYFADPDMDGMQRHYEAIAQASSLGQVIFCTRQFPYTPESIASLAQIENVVGLKDEWGDLKTFIATVERLGDRLAWINGMAEPYVPAYFAAGATSFTTGMANFAPEIPLAIYNAVVAGEYAACGRLVTEQVSPIARLRAKRKNNPVMVIKEAMAMMGLPAGPGRLPLTPLDPEDRAELRQILGALRLLG